MKIMLILNTQVGFKGRFCPTWHLLWFTLTKFILEDVLKDSYPENFVIFAEKFRDGI